MKPTQPSDGGVRLLYLDIANQLEEKEGDL
jgi:hypothetical protein